MYKSADAAHQGDASWRKRYSEDEWEDIPGVSGHKRFKAGTYHTFDFFYLERGGGESNLYVHYNLVSTADFTGHKAYYGKDENDFLKRDQFRFELVGLNGRYNAAGNLVTADEAAVMPNNAKASGEGTVSSPKIEASSTTLSDGSTLASQTYTTGVTEDGNINFGNAVISEDLKNYTTQCIANGRNDDLPTYRYIVREHVPDDAVNASGVTWAAASEEQRRQGGFMKDRITYDGTIYYMTATVTSWMETGLDGVDYVRYGLSKKYYSDDTYTTPIEDSFISFTNRYVPLSGNVDLVKRNEAGGALPGAQFTLFKTEDCAESSVANDIGGNALIVTSGEDGKVSFNDVPVGVYYMKETAAPDGYALDGTVYKVTIEDSQDAARHSTIVVNGDSEDAPVNEVLNAKEGELSVVKVWQDANGRVVNGKDRTAHVVLKRKVQAPGTKRLHVHVKTDWGAWEGNQWVQADISKDFEVTNDVVIITWDDNGQFGWSEGRMTWGKDSSTITIEDRTDHSPSHTGGDNTRFRISGFESVEATDINLIFTYKNDSAMTSWFNGHLNSHANTLAVVSQEGKALAGDDSVDATFSEKVDLDSNNGWSSKWTVGDGFGFNLPATDASGHLYRYYVTEVDEDGIPLESGEDTALGYKLAGYSPNNSVGISNQGVLKVYNTVDNVPTADIVIKKVGGDGSTALPGAVFQLSVSTGGAYRLVSESDEIEGLGTVIADGVSYGAAFQTSDVQIQLKGLPDGAYKLDEVRVPPGYVNTLGEIKFSIEEGIVGRIESDDMQRVSLDTSGDIAILTIANEPGKPLPATGGPGLAGLYLVGFALVVFAGALLAVRARRGASR